MFIHSKQKTVFAILHHSSEKSKLQPWSASLRVMQGLYIWGLQDIISQTRQILGPTHLHSTVRPPSLGSPLTLAESNSGSLRDQWPVLPSQTWLPWPGYIHDPIFKRGMRNVKSETSSISRVESFFLAMHWLIFHNHLQTGHFTLPQGSPVA